MTRRAGNARRLRGLEAAPVDLIVRVDRVLHRDDEVLVAPNDQRRNAGGEIVYEGEFVLDAKTPYVQHSAPSTDDGPDRQVFVFRLRPANGALSEGETSTVTAVPIAKNNVESWSTSSTESKQASATEARLVKRYQNHLEAQGDRVTRQALLH